VGDKDSHGGWEPVQQISPSVIEAWEQRDRYPAFKRESVVVGAAAVGGGGGRMRGGLMGVRGAMVVCLVVSHLAGLWAVSCLRCFCVAVTD